VILRYALKTSSMGTNPFGLVVLLTTFTTICKITSLLSFSLCSLLLKILYKHCNGAWYLFTLLMLLWASTGISLTSTAIDHVCCLNLTDKKFFPMLCIK